MGFLSDTDKWFSRFRSREKGTDKLLDAGIDFSDLDESEINEDLGGRLVRNGGDGEVRIFGKYSSAEIEELMAWSGIFEELEAKGYTKHELDLQYLSELDQRIFVKENDQVLIHIRLKLSHFRFRLHPGAPRKKLLYIDWLMTAHPRARHFRPERLFPGQELPGLGIFSQLSDFIANLAIGLGARGAFNIPEYFHDALLFHRQFNFYDPVREAFFRALMRDLRKHGARKISRALAEGRVFDRNDHVVQWTPGEMISILSPELEEQVWSREYYTRVVREMKRNQYRLGDEAPSSSSS